MYYEPIAIDDLMARFASGQRLFHGFAFEDETEAPVVLVDLHLDGAQFLECWFHSCTFRRVSLVGTSFIRCNLKCTRFEECDLRNTRWDGCSVEALEIASSQTEGIEIGELYAYGNTIQEASLFLYCATPPST